MPTDEVTGLPHVIMPVEISDMFLPEERINYHHHFYNRRHPDLMGDLPPTQEFLSVPEDIPLNQLGGLAVRMSRGQRLPIELHIVGHDHFPVGPKIPHTLEEKFTTAVKACSGLVSRWAIDITASDPTSLIWMNDEVFEAVANPKVLCTERMQADGPADTRRRVLGNFFLRYAASQDLSHISPRIIDQFLFTAKDEERVSAGNFILREAIEVSLAPVLPLYAELRGEGMVHPHKPLLRRAIRKYIHPDRRAQVYPILAAQFAA